MEEINLIYLAEIFANYFKVKSADWNPNQRLSYIDRTSKFNKSFIEANKSKNTGHKNRYDLELSGTWAHASKCWRDIVKHLTERGYFFEASREDKRYNNGTYTWEKEYKIKFSNITLILGNRMCYGMSRMPDDSCNQKYISCDSLEFLNYVQNIIYKEN